MKISKTGLKLIQKFEGFRQNAYLCPANVWTIGFGATKWMNGDAVKKGEKITASDALILLEKQVNEHAAAMFKYIKVPLTPVSYTHLTLPTKA